MGQNGQRPLRHSSHQDPEATRGAAASYFLMLLDSGGDRLQVTIVIGFLGTSFDSATRNSREVQRFAWHRLRCAVFSQQRIFDLKSFLCSARDRWLLPSAGILEPIAPFNLAQGGGQSLLWGDNHCSLTPRVTLALIHWALAVSVVLIAASAMYVTW